jgi:hypothetical protein
VQRLERLQARPVEHRLGPMPVLVHQGADRRQPGHDRLPHGLVRVLREGLVEPADPETRAHANPAVVGRKRPRDELEQRGLAGAVAADQADALARLDAEVGTGQDDLLAEAERNLIEDEKRHRRGTGRGTAGRQL